MLTYQQEGVGTRTSQKFFLSAYKVYFTNHYVMFGEPHWTNRHI